MRPREGLRPTTPQQLDGMRTEPPPSEPCANPHSPAATAAALPPLDPPGVCARFHGLWVAPCDTGSVVGTRPNSGVFVRPVITNPAARKRATSQLSAGAMYPASRNTRVPLCSG